MDDQEIAVLMRELIAVTIREQNGESTPVAESNALLERFKAIAVTPIVDALINDVVKFMTVTCGNCGHQLETRSPDVFVQNGTHEVWSEIINRHLFKLFAAMAVVHKQVGARTVIDPKD